MGTVTKVSSPNQGEAKYRIRVFNGTDPKTGKKIVITETVTGYAAAHERERELEELKRKGALARPSKETLSEYLEGWLDTKEAEVRARTIYDYRRYLTRYIIDPPKEMPSELRIGRLRLRDLNREHVRRLYTWLRKRGKTLAHKRGPSPVAEEGLSPRSVQYLHAILRQALADAEHDGVLPSNPAALAKRQKRNAAGPKKRKPVHAMNKEQAAAFIEAARFDRYYALWCVLLFGGLRPEEAYALGWQHVDFETSRIQVERTLNRTGVKGWQLEATKTENSRRTVKLSPTAMAALKTWKAKQAAEKLQLGAEYEDHGFVFTTPFGRPLDHGTVSRGNYRRVCAAAGLGEWRETPPPGAPGPRGIARFLPEFRVYDLRHTHATLLLLSGVPLKVVSARLGHSTIVLTGDTYSHFLPEMDDRPADELETMLGGV